MYALTIQQPWPWAIFYASKDVENRPWRPAESKLPLDLAIHAGKAFDKAGYERLLAAGHTPPDPEAFPRGAIIGLATVTQIQTESSSIWFEGPYGWIIEPAYKLSPIACRGRQRLWKISHAVDDKIASQLRKIFGLPLFIP